MKKIAIEEHYQARCYRDYLLSRKDPPRLEIIDDGGREKVREWITASQYTVWSNEIQYKMGDLGGERLKDMDSVGIDMQVLSCSSGDLEMFDVPEGTAMATKINDELAHLVSRRPDRYAGFATLSLRNPEGAADELERAVKQLGLKGTMITPHVMGEYVDARKYWPIFETAAKLGVPVYIHPMPPARDSLHKYAGYPELVGAAWGFSAETGLSAMRLICSGIFDAYPDLKVILGHMGEALPYWMQRIDNRLSTLTWQIPRGPDGKLAFTPVASSLKKLPSRYLMDNFFITTSGVMWSPALLCGLLALGADRILFATDYPLESIEDSVRFMETAPISQGDREKIFHLNAEKLFGL